MSALKTQRSSPEVRKSEDVVTKVVVRKPVHYPFWFGGSASCCATLFTHPLDLGKLALVLALALSHSPA
jgi:dicarboxylate transporter 10